MIPYYGTHGSRQRINNKSIQEEYNICVLVTDAQKAVKKKESSHFEKRTSSKNAG